MTLPVTIGFMGPTTQEGDICMPHSVFVLEDHQDTLASICRSIEADPRLSLAGSAASLQGATEWFATQPKPRCALVDLGLPDGRGETLIRAIARDIDVLVMTVFADEKAVVGAIRAGAIGYLLKENTNADLSNAIVEVINGGSPMSPSIARHLLKHFNAATQAATPEKTLLTKRERHVLTLVVKGFSYKEMAECMSLSVHTVTSHIQNIYKKLSVSSRGEAVFEALQLGLVSLPGKAK